uniref:Programmed cell death protein 2 isoform X1 n=1 Tax=Rhizophora mucronata TaxID=61149 RepID=A0A2P2KNG7_RHIMU
MGQRGFALGYLQYLNTCSGALAMRSWKKAQNFLSSSPCFHKQLNIYFGGNSSQKHPTQKYRYDTSKLSINEFTVSSVLFLDSSELA